jgi:hypothetical protein
MALYARVATEEKTKDRGIFARRCTVSRGSVIPAGS